MTAAIRPTTTLMPSIRPDVSSTPQNNKYDGLTPQKEIITLTLILMPRIPTNDIKNGPMTPLTFDHAARPVSSPIATNSPTTEHTDAKEFVPYNIQRREEATENSKKVDE